MLNTTTKYLTCPKCEASLEVESKQREIEYGKILCTDCDGNFPILNGVAIVVKDVEQYIYEHAKGIIQNVPESKIPAEYMEAFLQAKSEIEVEHIEGDLEAERVNALYLMTHYLHAHDEKEKAWWTPLSGKGSAVIDPLMRMYWDKGPFTQIKNWVQEIAKAAPAKNVGALVELGCGVGGLYAALNPHLESYLGVDSSFASISFARRLNLGTNREAVIKIPEDLLHGTISREVKLSLNVASDGRADFIVGDVEIPPLKKNIWDATVALNLIDMLHEPAGLPKLQYSLLKENGIVIQSCPYIWHEAVATELRRILPKGIQNSSLAVEWLYANTGFSLERVLGQVPWLFFKHVRQLEIYSVDMFLGRKL